MTEKETEIEKQACCRDSDLLGREHEASVARAINNMPGPESVEEMCASFRVIGEPSRMRILLALMEGEMCVYHIAEATGGKQSAVSHQLRVLKDNKIVKSRRDGKNILYSVADEHVAKIIEMSKIHLHC